MGIGGDSGHLCAGRCVEYGQIALLLVRIRTTRSDINFLRPWVIADRIRSERNAGHSNQRQLGPVKGLNGAVRARGDDQLVELGNIEHALWFGETGERVNYEAGPEIDHLDRKSV